MATRLAAATGNFTTAATWGLVDATSLLDSQAGNFTIATAATWSQGAAFTPGAITIDGIAVKIATRAASPSGTMSVRLYNVTGAAAVAGTTVTINISDIDKDQGTAGTAVEGCSVGWYFFKFSAPVLLVVATNYRVEAQSSAATQVNLFRDATASNMSRMLRTTTTGAPAAGDNLFVCGEWTAAATKTDRTVTMEQTVATDYGGGSTTLASFGISKGGTVTYGVAAVNYVMRWSGVIQIWLSGTLNMGTVATPIPSTATAVCEFDCATTGDFGIVVWGTLVVQGVARTAGKNVVYTLLTADAAGGATSLTVGNDTGWLNTDEIAITGTTRTTTDAEANALTSGATATTLAVSALGVAHGGSASTGVQAEVILLTRNVQLRSTLSTAGAYVITQLTSVVNIDWCLFRYMYGAAAAKAGFRVNNTSGSVNLDYVCFRDFPSANGRGISLLATIALSFSNITAWMSSAVAHQHFLETAAGHTGALTLTDWCSCADTNTTGSTHIILQGNSVITFTRVYLSNGAVSGIQINATAGLTAPFTWTTGGVHGLTGTPIDFQSASAGYSFTDVNVWRNGTVIVQAQISDCTWTNCKFFGNLTSNFGATTNGNMVRWRWVNCTIAGDSTFATARGINILWAASVVDLRFENCSLGVATSIYVAHTTADMASSGSLTSLTGQMVFVNTTLGSATEFEAALLTAFMGYSFYARQRKDGTTNTHEKVFPRVGTIAYETTTFRTASPAEKLTPTNAILKLKASRKRIAIASGQSATVSVYVRKDGSYGGSAPRLVLLANPALGIDNDVVLDTMTVGSGVWEQLTGSSSPVAEEDGVLECYVDCDGTAGNVFVDDWSAAVA